MWQLLTALALAGPIEEIHQLEWDRASPASLAVYLSDGAPEAARVAALTALGRLRTPGALDVLPETAPDSGAEALAWAEALGFTPGAAPRIRAALGTAERWSVVERARHDGDLRAALALALGRQGDESDVALLVGMLDEPGPAGLAAARALGRLGYRGVEAPAAVPALLPLLDGLPRKAELAAYALTRLDTGSLTPAQIAQLVRAARQGRSVTVRALATRVLWPHLDEAGRQAQFRHAFSDHPDVLIKLLQALSPEASLPEQGLGFLLADRRVMVRRAAARGLAALDSPEATSELERAARGATGAWKTELLVLAAAHGGDPGDDALARVEVASHEDRLKLADVHTQSAVRLAAAMAAYEALTAPEALVLAQVGDASVRAEGARWLSEQLAPELVPSVVRLLAHEPDPVVRVHLLHALTAWATALDRPSEELEAALRARLGGGIQEHEAALEGLAVLGVPLEDVPAPHAFAEGQQPELAPDALTALVVTDHGSFRMAFHNDLAPLTVASFVQLAEQDFFDGIVVHRVVPGFVVQAGCPRGDGSGGPGYALPDEVSTAPYDVGTVGMALDGPDTGGSQFFVTLTPQPHLVGTYTVFAEVIDGMRVLRSLPQGAVITDVVVERGGPR